MMEGKTYLITGANSGIGYATAEGLAAQGGTVIMHARSREKGEAARAEIVKKTGNQAVHLLLADLSIISEVKRLAADVQARFNRLDVLINNAAIIPPQRTTTPDGLETQFAVNHLAYFILGNLLLPLLQSSAPARLVNVSSSLHHAGKVDFENLQSEKRYEFNPVGGAGWGCYANTKLMNVLFTREMARRLGANTTVTVNALHPGLIGTNLVRAAMPKWFQPLYRAVVSKPNRGAQTSIYLATSAEGGRVTGKYFTDCKEAPMAEAAKDDAAARRLWEISAALTQIETI
jgi:NAD(P)-dependent dehydrogenase (short-subunit alcohol dehydrogenase family)